MKNQALTHLLLYLSLFSDSEGCLLPAATDSSPHSGGQRCVHGVSNCSQGTELLPQFKAASAHPSGAHHSQFTRGHTLFASLHVITSVLCADADAAVLKKKKNHRLS